MKNNISADQIIEHFGLIPLEIEGGSFIQGYVSSEMIDKRSLPERYHLDKPMSTAIYYLLTSAPNSFSAMHKLLTDEVFHFYLGDPVELLELHPDGSSAISILGSEILEGQKVQHVVKQGVWQGSKIIPGGDWALLGTTMAPGFTIDDFELGDSNLLIEKYPDQKELIGKLTR